MSEEDPQRIATLAANAARVVELIAGNVDAVMRMPADGAGPAPDLAGCARAFAAQAADVAAAANEVIHAPLPGDPAGSAASPATRMALATRHLQTIERDLDAVTLIYGRACGWLADIAAVAEEHDPAPHGIDERGRFSTQFAAIRDALTNAAMQARERER